MDKIVKSAITSILALSVAGITTETIAASKQASPEKCYGIVKAGLNDCETFNSSCAGSSTKDRQPDAYIWLPKGACDKIVGSTRTPRKP